MARPHLLDVLRDKVLLADGAMGTRVQALTLDVEKDYWGHENCTDILVLSRPDLVRDIHRGYFEAGADMVETDTFGGSPVTLGEFGIADKAFEVNKRGGVQPAEAFMVNRDLLDRRGADTDQNIRARLERARTISAADYIWMTRERASLIAEMDAWLADTDVLVMPTCPIVAPTQAEVAAPDEFARKNAMALRNTSLWNFFDCCAISLPIPGTSLPAGLMIVARYGRDRELFAMASTVERALAS